MNVISSFDKIEDLQSYHDLFLQSAVNNGQLLKVDTPYLQFVFMHIANDPTCLSTLCLYNSNQIDITEFQRRIGLLILAKDSFIEEYQSLLTEPNKYIFIGSKTFFRKINHSNMVDSLYKKYYNFLKEKNIISLANGSLVLISDYVFTDEDFNYFSKNELSKESLKTINEFLLNYEETKNDNKFLINKINELHNAILDLQEENKLLAENLNNKFLTSWL